MPQPSIDADLEHRPAVARAEPFAMHDANTALSVASRALYEISESRFGFRDGHAVQVDFGLHAEIAARELPHRAPANGCTLKSYAVRIAEFHRVQIVLQALVERSFLVFARKPRFGCGLPARVRYAVLGPQGFRTGNGAAEKIGIVVTQAQLLRLWRGRDIEYSERLFSRQTKLNDNT